MQKEEILGLIDKNYTDFVNFIKTQSAEAFIFAPEDKWTSGQQCDHLIKAVRPVRLGLLLPKFIPSLLFGKSNRPSKSYDELIAKYQRKLAEGGRASAPFIPPTIKAADQQKIAKQLFSQKEKLIKALKNWEEKELDLYVMPHPLLGKLTIREMLYFTAYHATHHLDSIKHFKPE